MVWRRRRTTQLSSPIMPNSIGDVWPHSSHPQSSPSSSCYCSRSSRLAGAVHGATTNPPNYSNVQRARIGHVHSPGCRSHPLPPRHPTPAAIASRSRRTVRASLSLAAVWTSHTRAHQNFEIICRPVVGSTTTTRHPLPRQGLCLAAQDPTLAASYC